MYKGRPFPHTKPSGFGLDKPYTQAEERMEDALNAERLLIKKYKTYALLSTDPQIKTQYEQTAGRHQNHFDRLLSFLN